MISFTSVDLPEPLTPVTNISPSRGILAFKLSRLLRDMFLI